MRADLIFEGPALIQIKNWGVGAKLKDQVEHRRMVRGKHSYKREQDVQNRVPHLGMWDLGRDGTKREGSSQV